MKTTVSPSHAALRNPSRARMTIAKSFLCLLAALPAARAAALILGDTTTTSSISRGYNAIDIQTERYNGTGGTNPSVATGAESLAFGFYNMADGDYSVAIGSDNKAYNMGAFALGMNNEADSYALAVGFKNYAFSAYDNFGLPSMAFGANNSVGADQGIAFGLGNQANAYRSTAIGRDVINSTAYSLMIGPSNTAKVTIFDNGNVQVSGNIVKAGGGTVVLPTSGTLTLPAAGGSLVTTSGTQTITGTTTFTGATTLGGSSAAQQVVVDSTGNVGIGTATPSGKLNVSSTGQSYSNFDSYVSGTTGGATNYWERATIQFRRAQGTQASPTAVTNGDWLGELAFTGYYNVPFASTPPAANLFAKVDGNLVQSPYVPGRFDFLTSDGLSASQVRMTVKGTGDVGIGTQFPSARLHASKTVAASSTVYPLGARTDVTLNGASGSSASVVTGIYTESTYGASSSTGLNGSGGQLVAVRGVARNDSNQVVAKATGLQGEVWQYGVGSITDAYALSGGRPWLPSGSTITNAVALYLDVQKITGVTNGFGVYQTGTSDINYFAGNVGIGTSTPASNVKLDVNGATQLAGNVTIKNVGGVTSVIRISPAGDIGMGGFTSGTNPN